MNYDVILTCAVTGGSDIIDKNPGLPSSPAEIAAAAIEAVKAGAAVFEAGGMTQVITFKATFP